MSGKDKIDRINDQNDQKHRKYVSSNNKLITEYQDRKDVYNNDISIINAEKIAMRDELRQLYDFLKDVGGVLDRKVSVFDFVEEEPAPNIDAAEVEPLDRVHSADGFGFFRGFVNRSRARRYEKDVYFKSLDYTTNLKDKKQQIKHINDCCKIAKLYRDTIVTLRDAIRERIIPEFEYIKAFLIADVIRERYVSDQSLDDFKPFKITEYKNTRYNSHYQFVKNSFDFLDLCKAFFSKAILTELMNQCEITDQQREEFNRNIYIIQDKLALMEDNMEVKR